MSGIERVRATGNAIVDDLLAVRKWAGDGVSFGFSTAAGSYGAGYGRGEAGKGFAALNASQQAAAHDAIKLWNELVALDITPAAGGDADIRLAVSSMPSTAWAYTPSSTAQGGDVWLGTASFMNSAVKGNYAYLTIMHEIGHALGLSHPHESSGLLLGAAAPQGGAAAVASSFNGARAIDAMAWSLMSYRSHAGSDMEKGYSNESFGYAQTPMARDIAAIQHLYGANYETRAGDTVYRWSETSGEKFINGAGQGRPGANKVFETVWDGGGRDTFDLSNHTTDLTVDLAPGGWTSFGNSQLANLGNGHKAPGNVAAAFLYQDDARALIENAIGGTGNDKISGNVGDNVLVGGAGNDTLTGIAGRNVLIGDGLGNELALIGLARADIIPVTLPQVSKAGNDTLIGGAGNDIFVPGLGKNVVRGGEGADTLLLDAAFATLKITGSPDGVLTIAYQGGAVEASNIEFLAVREGIFSLIGPLDELAGRQYDAEIMLLYRAGLGRDLDPSGLDYWTAALENGNPMDRMALSLLDSPEFSQRFGAPDAMDDEGFVAVLYENVLDRQAGSSEIAYWHGQMEAGMAREHVLLAFAQSDENRALAGQETDTGPDLVAITQAQWAELWG